MRICLELQSYPFLQIHVLKILISVVIDKDICMYFNVIADTSI